MLKNLIKILKSKIWIFGIIFGILIISIPSYYFFKKELIIWNMWYYYYLLEISLTIIIAILFWLFFWLTLYKMFFFSKSKTWIWFIWWFLWILVSGCPACTITFASYLGLAWIISVFPFWWIELKILSVLILLYAVYVWIRDLELCKIKK
jgi:hypothetical protein